MKEVLHAVAVATAVLALAGCGSDTDDGGSSETISAQEWSNRVTGLCDENRERAMAAVDELQDELEGVSEEERVVRVFDLSVKTSEPLLDELDALPRPEGREEQADRFRQRLRDSLPLLQRGARALRSGNAAEADKTNDQILEIAGETRRLARELDVESCIPRGSR